MTVSEELKDHCIKKAERLERFYNRIQNIDMILDGHDGQHFAEIIVHADGTQPFVASEEREDAFAAVDVLMDKIERQVRRYKDRQRNRKHPTG